MQNSVDQMIEKAHSFSKQGQHKEAAELYASVLAKHPSNKRAQQGLLYLNSIGAIKLKVSSPPQDVLNTLISLYQSGHFEELQQKVKVLLREHPLSSLLYNILGATQTSIKNFDAALLSFQMALTITPNYAEALNNISVVFRDLKRYDHALLSVKKALALQSSYPEAHNNLGIILDDFKRYEEAIAAYETALKYKPDYSEASKNLGNTWNVLKQFDAACGAYAKAVALNPKNSEALAKKIHLQSHMCDWNSLPLDLQNLHILGIAGSSVSPFSMLACEDYPVRHKLRSERYIQENFSPQKQTPLFKKRTGDQKIRIGYFSSDFYDHATMFLMAGLFEKHNKDRFCINAYSFGPDKKDGMQSRLQKAVDLYRDVRALNDQQIAELARQDMIDIAVDLKGYTQDSRLGIFYHRAAPIQINYLGYPGTIGASFMDYILADKIVLPPELQKSFTEKVLYLPNCYQVNDDTRKISYRSYTRADEGLPEKGFIFCCFNNNFKISPTEFDIWMRLLLKVDQSILWLFEGNPWTEKNLKKEAEKRGVDSRRLFFAKKRPLADHLARLKLANLFLDTFNYNAHTTASDALWVGLPVLTKVGQGFAARVGASLLTAIGMPELITKTSEHYEEQALDLALHPAKLADLKDKLIKNRTIAPLFDTELFTRHIESAYQIVYKRWCDGRNPEVIEIPN